MATPKPGEYFPGTNLIRCDNDCNKQKRGGGSDKWHCVPDKDEPCTPNDPKQPGRCHCQAFRRKTPKDDWDPVEPDKNGDFDIDDDYKYECFCVREKARPSKIRRTGLARRTVTARKKAVKRAPPKKSKSKRRVSRK